MSSRCYCAGNGDVGLAWPRITRRMVMHQDDGSSVELKPPFDNFARVNRCVAKRTVAKQLVTNQPMTDVEEEHAKLLGSPRGQRSAQIMHKCLGVPEHWALLKIKTQHVTKGVAQCAEPCHNVRLTPIARAIASGEAMKSPESEENVPSSWSAMGSARQPAKGSSKRAKRV